MNRNTKLTAEHQNNQHSVTWQSCITAQTKKIKSPDPIMYSFYRGTIESILSSCITVCLWRPYHFLPQEPAVYCGSSYEDHWCPFSVPTGHLQHLPHPKSHQDYRCPFPSHSLVSLLLLERRLQSLQAKINKPNDRFFHQALQMLNSLPALAPLSPVPPLPPTTDSGSRTLPINTSNLRNYIEAVLFTSSLMFIVFI